MITYIVRRILLMIPTLLGITVMVFLIVRFAPGNPVAGPRDAGAISSESRAAVEVYYEKKLGLDQPIWRQYFNWWRSMFSAVTLVAMNFLGERLREAFDPKWRTRA